jgi:hypothetical protein
MFGLHAHRRAFIWLFGSLVIRLVVQTGRAAAFEGS